MAKKATSKETGRGARSAKTRGEQETGTAVQEMPQAKRGEVVERPGSVRAGSRSHPRADRPAGAGHLEASRLSSRRR
jgi:hypothetical protein